MNRQHRTGSRALMILVFLFLYAPILILIVFSFNEGNSNAVWQGFSLRWYEALFHNKKMMEAVSNTLLIAILATVIPMPAVRGFHWRLEYFCPVGGGLPLYLPGQHLPGAHAPAGNGLLDAAAGPYCL